MEFYHLVKYKFISDATKQNESDVGNDNFKIHPIIVCKSVLFLLYLSFLVVLLFNVTLRFTSKAVNKNQMKSMPFHTRSKPSVTNPFFIHSKILL